MERRCAVQPFAPGYPSPGGGRAPITAGDDPLPIRRRRKLEHVAWAGRLGDRGGSGLDDLQLVHDCVTEVDPGRCDPAVQLFGRPLRMPLIIGAMTGGAPEVREVNRTLARAAAEVGAAMAVGSQSSGLADPAVRDSYSVVRNAHPDGLILANVGSGASPEDARRAVEMVAADVLVVHLNPAQELFMAEGDRTFAGLLARLSAIVATVPVPVVAKEIGFGIARGPALALLAAGVAGLDVAGRGGTDFIAIERARRGLLAPTPFSAWGVPTAPALIEVLDAVGGRVPVIASGGVRSGLDIARCLAVGAAAAAIAAPLLRALQKGGAPGLRAALDALRDELVTAMVLAGASDLRGLRRAPVVIGGATRAWLHERGVRTAPFARRG